MHSIRGVETAPIECYICGRTFNVELIVTAEKDGTGRTDIVVTQSGDTSHQCEE